MFGSDIDSIIKQLKSSAARRREKAFDRLERTTRKGLSEKSACRALRASVDDYPPPKYERRGSSEALVWAAAEGPYPSLIPLIRELYSLMNDGARGAALALLAQLKDQDAARTYMQLLHDYNWPARTYPAMVLPFQRNPRHAEILFPKLVEISLGSPGEILAFETCLSYCQAGMIADDPTPDILGPLLDAYHIRRNKIAPHQQKEGTSWIWEDEYLGSRYDAGLLLDLMGYFPTDEVRSVLREAINYRDPRLKCIAITSLIHQDADVSTSQLEEAAASAEMRIFLHEGLQALQRLDFYPQKYLTQEAFAEAVLTACGERQDAAATRGSRQASLLGCEGGPKQVLG